LAVCVVGATVTAAMTAGLTVRTIGWIVLEGAATCTSICGG
jgi:hypothetical protein